MLRKILLIAAFPVVAGLWLIGWVMYVIGGKDE